MKITFPSFEYAPLQSLTICNYVKSEVVQAPDEEVCLEARRNDSIWMRLALNASESRTATHVHLDMCREEVFKKIPTATATVEQIEEGLAKYFAEEANTHVKASFRLPGHETSPTSIITVLSKIRSGTPGKGVRLSGGTLEVEGEPVTSLEWRYRTKNGKEYLNCLVESDLAGKIDESYLQTAYVQAEIAFRSLLLDEQVANSNA